MSCTIAGAKSLSFLRLCFSFMFYLVNENIYFPLDTDSQTVHGQDR